MNWNFDMASAPRGRTETRTRKGKDGKTIEYSVRIEEHVWLASDTEEKAFRSYWVEPTKHTPNGRWAGFTEGQKPIAWMPFVTPDHPGLSSHLVAE